ncbi:MAG: AcrR family transcriptional regulator [Myxococcota bacterium]|jgi:AcrR family transcriptional regulator
MVARSRGRHAGRTTSLTSAEPKEGRHPGQPKPAQPKRVRFANVRAPKPVLPTETEQRLTPRQQEVFDRLEDLVKEDGLAALTMGKIAAHMGCSLRTLYGISPSKDELVLAAVDRNLRRIGREAIERLDPAMNALEMLRAYLAVANEAVEPTRMIFARELGSLPGAKRLLDSHEDYVVAVTKSLLDRAIDEGLIPPVDTAPVAHILGGLGREFGHPDVSDIVDGSPKQAARMVTEIILRGLAQS